MDYMLYIATGLLAACIVALYQLKHSRAEYIAKLEERVGLSDRIVELLKKKSELQEEQLTILRAALAAVPGETLPKTKG